MIILDEGRRMKDCGIGSADGFKIVPKAYLNH